MAPNPPLPLREFSFDNVPFPGGLENMPKDNADLSRTITIVNKIRMCKVTEVRVNDQSGAGDNRKASETRQMP